MKTKRNKHKNNGKVSARALLAEAEATKRLAKAARDHLALVKAEQKQARKAYKQARKAAKRARKEAKLAVKMLKAQHADNLHIPKPRSARHLTLPAPRKTAGQRKSMPPSLSPAIVARVVPADRVEAGAG